ncbi:MAG TPA: response regulator [Chryseosolibacter sp.]|nr:response regulator [Chryseosolibacter sp.]
MVYLIDDDYDDLEIVQEALLQHSYKGPVLTIDNGKKLMDQLSDTTLSPEPRVIVLDLNMPLLDGFETLEKIRQHPMFSALPVIILTASAKKEDEIRSFELGCDYFLTKPSKISEYSTLTALVKKFMAPEANS